MLATTALLLFAPAALAQSLKPDEVYSSIAVEPISDAQSGARSGWARAPRL